MLRLRQGLPCWAGWAPGVGLKAGLVAMPRRLALRLPKSTRRGPDAEALPKHQLLLLSCMPLWWLIANIVTSSLTMCRV